MAHAEVVSADAVLLQMAPEDDAAMGFDVRDRVRSGALAASCAGFVVIPSLGPLLGKGEQTRRYDTVITPPDYAFAVWAPIFAGCVASTVAQCLPGARDEAVSRRTGWPLAGAYAVNAGWSLAAQSGRFGWTPALLPAATACAAVGYARLQHIPVRSRTVDLTSISTGLLLGWTVLASAVNVAAGALVAGADKTSPRTVASSAAGLLAVSGAVAAAAAGGDRGWLPLAAASGWGLATTAVTTGRPKGVRAAAALGAAGVAAIALRKSLSRRTPGPARKRV
ncbi:hypothetical protein AB0C29_13090 [Actinoplanes sp. NPDC048791]|uniref:hypothetical protein n=1 Tax=Actinoplanes sp. NPDC048791 TaxID=3154623 RepID=UPI0033F1FC7D